MFQCTFTIFNINYSLTYTEILHPCQKPDEKKNQIIGIKFVLKNTKAKKNPKTLILIASISASVKLLIFSLAIINYQYFYQNSSDLMVSIFLSKKTCLGSLN